MGAIRSIGSSGKFSFKGVARVGNQPENGCELRDSFRFFLRDIRAANRESDLPNEKRLLERTNIFTLQRVLAQAQGSLRSFRVSERLLADSVRDPSYLGHEGKKGAPMTTQKV